MDEYNLPIGGDIGPLLNSLGQIRDNLKTTNEAAKDTGKAIKDSFTDAADAADKANKVIVQSAAAYNVANNSIADLTDALKAYQDNAFTEKDISKLKDYNAQIVSIEKEIDRLGTVGKKSYADQTGQIERLNTALKLYKEMIVSATNTDQITKYNKKIEDTQAALTKLSNAGKTGYDALGNKMQQTLGIQEEINAEIKDFQAQIAKATDPAQIAKLNGQLEQTQQELKNLNNAGKSGFDEFGNAIEKDVSLTQGLLTGLKSVALAFGVVFGIQAVVNFGKELFEVANQASGIDRAFTNLNRPDLLPKLREQTQGFVTDLDLERLTVKANNFNIPLDKLGTLLLFASQRAKDTGANVEDLTNNIVDGLGKKSTRIIDNLGISAIEVQKEFKKVGDFTTAVTNIIERDMGKSGVAVDTLADKTNRAGVFFSNLFKDFASKTVAAFNPDIADNNVIATKITAITTKIGDLSKLTDAQRQKAINDQIAAIAKYSVAYSTAQQKLNDGDFAFASTAKQNVKTAGEDLAARQAVLATLQKQSAALSEQQRIQKGITSDAEKQAQITELRGKVSNFVVGITGTQADKEALIQQANDLQKIVDESNAKAEGKQEKAEAAAAKKALERAKVVGDEKLKLQNEITQALAKESSESNEVAINTENAKYRVALDTLNKEKKDFPELTKIIDTAIEAERVAHIGRLAVLDKKQADAQLRILNDGQNALATVLKKSDDDQIKNINTHYAEVTEKAKKAGLLTTEVQEQLATQQFKDINDVITASINKNDKETEEITIANILTRQKRAGETDTAYELANQKAILDVKIQYSNLALKLIQNDPSKAKEAASLKETIATLQTQLTGVTKKITTDSQFSFSKTIQDGLGLNDADFANLKLAGDATIKLFDGITDSIVAGYQKQIDASDVRLTALKSQLDTAQTYLDAQNDLRDKGYANDADAAQRNVDTVNASIAQETTAREQAVKEEAAAQKTVAEIQAAAIAANSIEQASNLATAATKIFKANAGVPFLGVALAIGAVAALLAGFFAIKKSISAATSSTTAMKKGGYVGGDSHDNGGNTYRSIDGKDPNNIEIEKGEFIVNKTSVEKHDDLINAINKDDFSKLNMSSYSMQELLKATGVDLHSEVAAQVGKDTVTKQDKIEAATVIVLPSSGDHHLNKISKGIDKLVKFEETKETITDMGDHIRIVKGNRIEKIKKNGNERKV